MTLFQQQESDSEEEGDEMVDSTPMSAGDPIATAAAASVVYAWYKFYMKGDKESGIFVGLWAPTLLAAAGYLQQKDVVRKVRQGFSSL